MNEEVISKKKKRRNCSFIGCEVNNIAFPNVRMFGFPVTRPDVCSEWLDNCANSSLIPLSQSALKERKVCQHHFSHDNFLNDMHNLLKKDAVPTLVSYVDSPITEENVGVDIVPGLNQAESRTKRENIPIVITVPADVPRPLPGPSNSEQISCTLFPVINPNQTPPRVSEETAVIEGSPSTPYTPEYKKFKKSKNRPCTPRKVVTPRKQKLIQQLKACSRAKLKFRAQNKRLQAKQKKITKSELILGMREYLPESVAKFVAMQLSHAGEKRRPWTEDERQISLTMSYMSPK